MKMISLAKGASIEDNPFNPHINRIRFVLWAVLIVFIEHFMGLRRNTQQIERDRDTVKQNKKETCIEFCCHNIRHVLP